MGSSRRRDRNRKRRGRDRPAASVARTASLSPQVRQTLQHADQLRVRGQVRQAARYYREVLAKASKHPAAMMGLAECFLRMNRLDEGLRLGREACRIAGPRPELLASMSEFLLVSNQIPEAGEYAERALQRDPRNIRALLIRAQAHEQQREYEKAIPCIDRVLELIPDHLLALNLRARLLRRLKRLDEARCVLDSLLERQQLPSEMRRLALNELGMTRDLLGKFDAAYDAFEECGRETLASPDARRVDRNAFPREVEAYRDVVTHELMCERLTAVGDPQPDGDRSHPVFLVGFPRSGTTMTEQILAAHWKVVTTDEQPYLNTVKASILNIARRKAPIALLLETIRTEHIPQLRSAYWQAVAQRTTLPDDHQVFIDKLPLNIIDLPLINLVFPRSRIIVALRDPRDVCLSGFMQDFGFNEAMIHFTSFESTTRLYDQVMSLYLEKRACIHLPRIEVRYEDTVSDLETQARRMLDHLGLEWTDDVLRFHDAAKKRAVSTPSFAAVVEPVHQRAVQRWKNYRARVAPNLPRLERFVREFGYEPAGDQND